MNKLLMFILVVCLCKSIDAFCAKRCGEPWTIGPCETCACAAPAATSCTTCPTMSSCGCPTMSSCGCPTMSSCGCPNLDSKCSCMDPECQCLKSKTRFPEVEYPMSISEMKPYFVGCCA